MSTKRGGEGCSSINCSNTRRKCPGLSFFRFPKDPDRCKRWAINTRRADLLDKSTTQLYNYVLCADHFGQSQFSDPFRKRLLGTAIPSIFSVPNPPKSTENKRRILIRIVETKKDTSTMVSAKIVSPTPTMVSAKIVSPTPTLVSNKIDSETPPMEPDKIASETPGSKTAVTDADTSLDLPVIRRKTISATLTLREQRLMTNLKRQYQITRRLKRKMATLLADREAEVMPVKYLIGQLSHYLSGSCLEFVSTQLKIAHSKKNGYRWSKLMKQICMTLRCQSMKAYRTLGTVFKLPTMTTLKSWGKNDGGEGDGQTGILRKCLTEKLQECERKSESESEGESEDEDDHTSV